MGWLPGPGARTAQPMARKKKGRRPAPGLAGLGIWAVLVVTLGLIGYACSHSEKSSQTASTAASPAARTEVPGATTVAPAAQATEPVSIPSPVSSPMPSASAEPSPAPSGPRLAIIIDDCGQWPATERAFIALPVPLTLSVLPDVRYNHVISREAAAAGKGVMLHLPMETLSGINPGPGKVTTEMDDDAITAQVEHDLADVDLAQGVNNHEGSKATADTRVMNAVISVLAKDGRFFIDSRTNSKSVGQAVATEHGVHTASRDVFLDNRADVAYSEGQLREAAALAEKNGSAIAIGHPRPTTLEALRTIIPEFQARGITFVLVSSLVH
jgi:polysaccharide deacetylase 2 family uncharacterized protein YibQ